jgi:hypothetical protein
MRPVMRLWLAAAALVAAGALAGGIALGLRSPQVSRRAPAAAPARPAAPSRATAASASPARATPATAAYSLRTLDDTGDGAFNQLLGINDNGHIAGHFGSGAAGHPSRGSAAAGQAGDTVAFYLMGGRYVSVGSPARAAPSPPASQLLGVNNRDVAVGFYTDAAGRDHGYTYDIATRTFSPVTVPGASSVTAAAINDSGSVAGFCTGRGHATEGFLQRHSGQLYVLRVPGATMTEALGVNDQGEVVGAYRLGRGGGAITRGFTWTRARGFRTVAGPDGAVATTINGVNNAGDLVGYYVSGEGRTDGLVATPDR